MSFLYETTDFKDIKIVYLVLGPTCNMKCRHCHQTPDKNVSISMQTLTSEVLQFLDNFIKFSQNQENRSEKDMIQYSVVFWGGEPLLHWSLIRDIVVRFTEKYDLLKNPFFRFDITTNGLGLTEEIVDFINLYEIAVSFSYDAPYPWAVRGYVSDSICDLVNKIHRVSIISTGCSYNCDPLLAYKCLQAKFPKARYVCRIEVMRTFEELDNDIDNYDFDKLRYVIRKLVVAAKMGNTFASSYLRKMISNKLSDDNNANYFHKSGGVGICVSGKNELSVALDGSIPFCYNSYKVIGSILKDSLDSIFAKASAIWRSLYDTSCSTCEVRDFCMWGCILLLRDSNNRMYVCDKFRIPFYRIVSEEVKKIALPLTNEEIEWYQKQEEIVKKQVEVFLNEGKRFEIEHTRFPND